MVSKCLLSDGGWRSAAVLVAGLLCVTLVPAAPAAAVHGAVPGDFNGDGYRDAVLPAPGADVAGQQAAGAVVVLYGSASGLSATRRKTITQNTAGVPRSAEPFDGKPELFVGAAGENNSTGAGWVFPGGSSGPTVKGSRVFTAASVNLTQRSGTLLGGNGLLWVI